MTNLRVYADELELNKNELLELENCSLKIRFIEDFLFRDINEFRNCNLNISKVIKAREKFFELHTGKLKRLSLNRLTTYLPVGIKKLNDFLDGGLPVNKVIELRGDLMSGKTLFCLNIALDLLRIGKRLLFIDTDYGLCSTVFFDLLQDTVDDEDEIIQLMKRMDICFLNDYQQLITRLDKLYLSQKAGASDYDFLVIDSIISPLAVECLRLRTPVGMKATNERIDLFIGLITKLLTASLTILTTNILKANCLPSTWTNRCDLILKITKVEQTTCMFELRTMKPFRCLNSLSCSNDLNELILLSDDFDSQSGKGQQNGRTTPNSTAISLHSLSIQTMESSGRGCAPNPTSAACLSKQNNSQRSSLIVDQAENGSPPFGESDSSLFPAAFTYTLTDRGAINVIAD